MTRSILMGLGLLLVSGALSAQPPPPPPLYVHEISQKLLDDPTPQNFATYADLFAPDLKVVSNGRQIAPDKDSWLEIERKRLGKHGRGVIGHSEGQNEVFLVDEYDDYSDMPESMFSPGIRFDPRPVIRAALYQIGADHLIHRIEILQGGSFWIPASQP